MFFFFIVYIEHGFLKMQDLYMMKIYILLKTHTLLRPDEVLQTCLEIWIVASTRKTKNIKLKGKIQIPSVTWHEKSLLCTTRLSPFESVLAQCNFSHKCRWQTEKYQETVKCSGTNMGFGVSQTWVSI